jgi:hypothetical protein
MGTFVHIARSGQYSLDVALQLERNVMKPFALVLIGLAACATPSAQGADRDALVSFVRDREPGVQHCYEQQLSLQPGLAGQLVVELTVDRKGWISGVSVGDDTLQSEKVRKCVLTLVRSWKFPSIDKDEAAFEFSWKFGPASPTP